MLRRLFIEHPESLGETYAVHQRKAFGIAWVLFRTAVACCIHGVVPGFFATTASAAVAGLHSRLGARRVP